MYKMFIIEVFLMSVLFQFPIYALICLPGHFIKLLYLNLKYKTNPVYKMIEVTCRPMSEYMIIKVQGHSLCSIGLIDYLLV